MIKQIITIFVVSVVLSNIVMAQSLNISLKGDVLKLGETVKATAQIVNETSKPVVWIVESYIYSTNPKVAVPRRVSKRINLSARGNTQVEIIFPTDWLVYNGRYKVISEVFDEEYNLVSKSSEEFELVGGYLPLEVQAFVCRDVACKQRSKIFLKGENVYLTYRSEVPELELDARLITPDGKSRAFSLPASIDLDQAGDYELTIDFEKSGYEKVTKKVMFGVTEAASEEIPATKE